MRSEGGRCGQARRLLVARIAPCSTTGCGEEATTVDVWCDGPAPHRSPIGRRAQCVHRSRFASNWVIVLTRNPTRIRGVITVDVPRACDCVSDEFHAYVKDIGPIYSTAQLNDVWKHRS